MLTNDQCIEIAEKVWGWEVDGVIINPSNSYAYHIVDEHNYADYDEGDTLQGQINSWQGFSRTVEAMIGHKGAKKFCDKLQINLAASLAGAIYIEDLWEATHLAALEALE